MMNGYDALNVCVEF